MATRRERQQRRHKRVKSVEPEAVPVKKQEKRRGLNALYHDKYKILLFIPFILLVFALLQIGVMYATTGEFLHKGVSLSGGITITVSTQEADVASIESMLTQEFPNRALIVRGVSELGKLKGITVQVATDDEGPDILSLEKNIVNSLDTVIPGASDDYSVEVIGSSLGNAFFTQTLKAVAMAFILMGMVIFLYFGYNGWAKTAAVLLSVVASILVFKAISIPLYILALLITIGLIVLYIKFSPPSAAVILAAFSDIVITLAVVNVLGIKISTAGIAAFLMLIGYSVDTDILLSTRVLKRNKGSIYHRIVSSLQTGMMMSITSGAAALIGFLVSRSDEIKQIMLIILIGLITDIIVTWLQNTGIIRLYAERREKA